MGFRVMTSSGAIKQGVVQVLSTPNLAASLIVQAQDETLQDNTSVVVAGPYTQGAFTLTIESGAIFMVL